jgi:GNAT superfamily N-acetyltransferase
VVTKVRWADRDDAGAIAQVHVAAWRVGYRGLVAAELIDRLSIEVRAGQWREWLEGDRTRTLVGGRGRAIEGFCSLAMPARDPAESADVAEIPAFYVAPAAWRRGVGKALMGRALDEMRSAGFRQGVVWVLEGNRRALEFYAELGWRLDGGRDEWEPHGGGRLPVVSLRREVPVDGG